jgi:hypothetical protein
MTSLVLTGLDGANPLGFLAALGVLNVLTDAAPEGAAPRLAWTYQGAWRPVFSSGEDGLTVEALVKKVIADLATWKKEPAIELEYDGVRDLKPPPATYRAFLERLVVKAEPTRRRSVDLSAALGTDVAVDRSGNTKPTALHFTAGQQEFLSMVNELVKEIREEDVLEALVGPWRYARSLPVLKWDATVFREYALRAGDPSKEEPTGVPGADWLAFRGLSFIRVAPRGRHIQTTGCFGEWKTGGFRWPLWSPALARETLRSVLAYPQLEQVPERARRARGIAVVFEARIRRSDQGGYGSFSPASVI